MQVNQLQWLHAVPSVMLFLFLIAALLYVIVKRSDRSSAKLLAILGVSILCCVQAARTLFNFALALNFDPEDFILYSGLFSIVVTLFHILALSLILSAVFAGRGFADTSQVPDDEHLPVSSGNPYSPPVNG